MGLIYRAEIHPTKREVLMDWLPRQPWFAAADASGLEQIGSYRFDDPAGAVGIETHLVLIDGQLMQVPLTYRAGPLTTPSAVLVTQMTHSVLGPRWIYDGCTDPVYASVTAEAILQGKRQSPMYFENAGVREDIPETVRAHGTGTSRAQVPTPRSVVTRLDGAVGTMQMGALEILVHHLPGPAADQQNGGELLLGEWDEARIPHLLAEIRR